MKYWIIAGGMLLLGIAGGYIATSIEFRGARELFLISFYPEGVPENVETIATMDAPKVVVVNGATYDFGAMEKQEKKSHAFVFRNEGKAPLKIYLLSTTCKCAFSDLENEEIAPGEETEVILEWQPENYSRSFSQAAKIKTNDPLNDVVELRIEGRVSQPLWAFPEKLIVSQIRSSEGFSADVYVFSRDENLELNRLALANDATSEFYELSSEPLADDDEMLDLQSARSGYRISVVAKPGLALAPLDQTIELLTSLSDTEPLEIPLVGLVKGDITLSSQGPLAFNDRLNLLNVGLVGKGGTQTATIGLMVRGEHSGNVNMWIEEGGVAPEGYLRASLGEPQRVGGAQMIPLEITVPSEKGAIDRMGPETDNYGRIEIQTDHPTDTKITVFVRFAVEG